MRRGGVAARLGCGRDGASGWALGRRGSAQGVLLSALRMQREGGQAGSSVTLPDTGALCLPNTRSRLPLASQEWAFYRQAPGTDNHGAPARSQGCPP